MNKKDFPLAAKIIWNADVKRLDFIHNYFSVLGSKNTKYYKLLILFEKNPKIEAQLLKKKFSEEIGGSYSSTLQNLQSTLLSLIALQNDKSSKWIRLQKIDMLFCEGYFQEASKMAQKIYAEFEQQEDFQGMLDANALIYRMNYHDVANAKEKKKMRDEALHRNRILHQQLVVAYDYHDFSEQVHEMFLQYPEENEVFVQKCEVFLQHKLMMNCQVSGNYANTSYLQLKSFFLNKLGRLQEAVELKKQQFQFINKMHFLKERRLAQAFVGFISLAYHCNDEKVWRFFNSQNDQAIQNSKTDAIYSFRFYSYQARFSQVMLNGTLDQYFALVEDFLRDTEFRDDPNFSADYCKQLQYYEAVYRFYQSRFDDSLKVVENIVDQLKERFQDFYSLCLCIFNHLELSNHILVKSQLLSVRRALLKYHPNALQSMELLDLLSKFNNAKIKGADTDLILHELQVLVKNGPISKVFSHHLGLFIQVWLERQKTVTKELQLRTTKEKKYL